MKMRRGYPADTRSQMAITEAYEKESWAALKHFLDQSTNLENASLPAAAETRIETQKPFICRTTRPKTPQINSSGSVYTDDIKPEETITELTGLSFMRPVRPDIKASLFGDTGGRKDYLKRRYEQTPEMRYEHPVTSSMEYGWKLFELMPKSEMKRPDHAKTGLIHETFFRRGRLSLRTSEDCI